jgi:hypothetical protein
MSSGKGMLFYTLFHLSSIQQLPAVEPWLCSWLGPDAKVLTPEGWFEQGHDILGDKHDSKGFWMPNMKTGIFIWDLPPTSAAVALEKLRKPKSSIKIPYTC